MTKYKIIQNLKTGKDEFSFNATLFNEDLSNWNVSAVSNYNDFSLNTPNWTLPKPNF